MRLSEFLYNLATDKYRSAIYRPLKFILLLVSFAYGAAVRLASGFWRLFPLRLDARVISVGNITLGGTGKTALVAYITSLLRDKGRSVAILSRGYKRRVAAGSGLKSGGMNVEAMGDEPFMLQLRFPGVPVIVGADRGRSAAEAIKGHAAGTLILDDGFQQWRLAKDLEIVAIDALNPFGNGRLLPRGVLREPLSCLRRADIFVITKADLAGGTAGLKTTLHKINPRALVVESRHNPAGFYDLASPGKLLHAGSLRGKGAVLFCGIGDPDSFQRLAKGLGINAALCLRFPDHHSYSQQDLERISGEAGKKGIDILITTEKDAARLGRQSSVFSLQRILVLRIELVIEENDKERFNNRLLTLPAL